MWRVIEIRGNQSLHQLHTTIFKAFDRWDDHLYSFFMSKDRHDATQEYASPYFFEEDEFPTEALPRDAAQARTDTLNLRRGLKFWYMFDYGDDWEHAVEVMSIAQDEPRRRYPRIVERQGESPDQYHDYEEEPEFLEDDLTEPGRVIRMFPKSET